MLLWFNKKKTEQPIARQNLRGREDAEKKKGRVPADTEGIDMQEERKKPRVMLQHIDE